MVAPRKAAGRRNFGAGVKTMIRVDTPGETPGETTSDQLINLLRGNSLLVNRSPTGGG